VLAGGATPADASAKMANTISVSNRLRKTYNPVNVVSVRRFDEARKEKAVNMDVLDPNELLAPMPKSAQRHCGRSAVRVEPRPEDSRGRSLATAGAVLRRAGRARLSRFHVSDNGLPAIMDMDVLDPNELLAPMPKSPKNLDLP
jgi:hypothetical protein